MYRTKELKSKELVLGEAADAETDVADAVVRAASEAASRAAEPGEEAPRPAAMQPPIEINFILACINQ